MNPHNIRAARYAQRHRRRRPLQPLFHRQPQRVANHRLARNPQQQRRAQRPKLTQPPHNLKVMLSRFAEPYAWVKNDVFAANARRLSVRRSAPQCAYHIRHKIRVARIRPVVHQRRRCARVRYRACHIGVAPQSPHVVHHSRARRKRAPCHRRLVGVNADGNTQLRRQRLNHRNHPPQLLRRRHRRRLAVHRRGARGLAAHIHNIRALRLKAQSLFQRGGNIRAQPVAAERIGRGVDDAHNISALAPLKQAIPDARFLGRARLLLSH